MPAAASSKTEQRLVEQPHKKALLRRMNRIGGQVQGITRMIAEDRYCVDLLVQISAVRSALNQVGLQIVEDHTRGCVTRAIQAGEEQEAIDELMSVLGKFAR